MVELLSWSFLLINRKPGEKTILNRPFPTYENALILILNRRCIMPLPILLRGDHLSGSPLPGWNYRKPVTLSRASGAVSNYQMKLLVGESSGATGENVDCESHCNSDFSDLRFTAADGVTLLDYWIEEITGSTPNQLATVWIEFDSIGTSATTFYMYYGNAGASAYSNGIDTFEYFDDFEWGTDEDDITDSGGGITWSKTAVGSSTAKIDTSMSWSGTRSMRLYRDGTNNPWGYFSKTPGTDYAICWTAYKEDAAIFTTYHGNGTKLIYDSIFTNELIYTNSSSTGVGLTNGYWGRFEITEINFAGNSHDLWFGYDLRAWGLLKNNGTMLSNAGGNGLIIFANEANTTNCWVDNVFVRQWNAVEPAWGAWGAEEGA